jgi:hypothetical protein
MDIWKQSLVASYLYQNEQGVDTQGCLTVIRRVMTQEEFEAIVVQETATVEDFNVTKFNECVVQYKHFT